VAGFQAPLAGRFWALSDIGEFRSPLRKLVRFFQDSRDNWKQKCQAAKKQCKRLSNQVRAVESSRSRWRLRAEQFQQQVEELEQQLAELKRQQPATG